MELNNNCLEITFFIAYVYRKYFMKTISATKARNKIYKLIDETAEEKKPIQITGKRSNAVLVSEEDWNSIQETLFLLSIPGMRESIIKGKNEPIKKCITKLPW